MWLGNSHTSQTSVYLNYHNTSLPSLFQSAKTKCFRFGFCFCFSLWYVSVDILGMNPNLNASFIYVSCVHYVLKFKFMYFKILLKNKFISFMFVFVSLYEFICTIGTQELMERVRYPKTGVRVLSCHVHMCAENQILLLCKSSKHWHRVSSPAPSFNH